MKIYRIGQTAEDVLEELRRNGNISLARTMIEQKARSLGFIGPFRHFSDRELKAPINSFEKRRGIWFSDSVQYIESLFGEPSKELLKKKLPNRVKMQTPNPGFKKNNLTIAYIKLENPLDYRCLGETNSKERIDDFYKERGIPSTAAHEYNDSPIFDEPKCSNVEILEKMGYDSAIVAESNGSVSYVIFNPNNIKSAEPFTYDDIGKVIPLSKRFNTSVNDIRF